MMLTKNHEGVLAALAEALLAVQADAEELGQPMKATAIIFDEDGQMALQYGYEIGDGAETRTDFVKVPLGDGSTVSREQARVIAKAYLKGASSRTAGIGDVFAPEEVARAPSIYQAGFDLDDCWIAYVECAWTGVISSSDIVVVSMSTGEVVYAGSANDEG